MLHKRKEIRDALAVRLNGLPTTADRVFVGRTRVLPAAHEPCLLIYTVEELSGRPLDGNPADIGRDLQVIIDGRTVTASEPDDLLDQIAAEVEDALRDNFLNGLVFDLLLVRTVMDVKAEGENHLGAIRMEFRARYWQDAEDE